MNKSRFLHSLNPFKRWLKSSPANYLKFNSFPCYLITGLKNSGKTSLITNADLKLFDHSSIKKNRLLKKYVGEDFYLLKKAILVEHEIESTSHKNHYHFLRKLKSACYKKSLFGILLVINIEDLFKKNPQEMNEFTSNLFKQLEQLKKVFSSKTPVYIFLNKCDHITGFSEFFGELSREERWQIWGIPLATSANNFEAKFETEFTKLIHRLSNQLIWRLQQSHNPNQRALINDFPQQMAQLKEHIKNLLIKLFKPNDVIRLKGTFFTSCDQQMRAQQQAYPSTVFSQALINQEEKKSLAFFTHDLLDKLILNNYLVLNIKHKAHLLRTTFKYIMFGLMMSGAIALSIFWIINFKNQMMNINTASQAIAASKALAQVEGLSSIPSLTVRLKVLNNLQNAIDSLNSAQSSNLITNKLSTDRASDELKQHTIAAYSRALNAFLLPTVVNHLTRTITDQSSSDIEVYRALESYLMLGNQKQYRPNFILNTIQNSLENNYSDAVQAELLNNIQIFLSQYKANYKIDPKIIALGRYRLQQLDQTQLAYLILTSLAPNDQQLSLNLNANPNAAFLLTFVNPNITIDSMYTANSFSAMFPAAFDQAAKESVEGNWILGFRTNQSVSNSIIQKRSNELLRKYLDRYVNTWTQFIDNIKMVNYTNLAQLNKAISTLSQQNSILAQLIQLAQNNIIMPVAHLDPRLDAIKRIPLNDTSSLSLINLSTSFDQLHQFMSPIFIAQNQDEQTFKLTSYRMRNKGQNDAIESLLQKAPLYPEPIRSWIYNITMNTWQLMLDETQSYINQSWQQQIVSQYQSQIFDHYPFSETSNRDVSLQNFTYFFAANGLMDQFFQNYLSAFINTSQTPWTLQNLDGRTLDLSQSTLLAMQSAHRIQNTFFPDGAHHLHLRFHLTPIKMSPSLNKIKLILGKQSFTYQNSTQIKSHIFNWPDEDNAKKLSLIFYPKNNQSTSLQQSGEWGLCRLLNNNLIKPAKDHQYQIGFSHNNLTVQALIKFKNEKNPCALDLFDQFKIGDSL